MSKDGGNTLPENIIIGGDSAGGGLAIATMLKLRDEQKKLPSCSCLMSPWVDLLLSKDSITRNKDDYLRVHPEYSNLYVNNAEELKNPFVSPMYADLTGLPRMLIQVGEAEIFLDENRELAIKAQRAGVRVHLEVWPEMVHVFQMFGQFF